MSSEKRDSQPGVGDLVRVVESGNTAVVYSVGPEHIGIVFNPGLSTEYRTAARHADVTVIERANVT